MNYPNVMPLNRIIVVPGRNPRTYFDPDEMAELIASVRENGVIQSVLLRPVGDHFELVAGERRVRAATEAYLGEYDIPCLIKELTDDQCADLALIENIQRADMSPTEEAQEAARTLGRCGGDHDEAARRLGWSRATLDKRLALMNCSEKVQLALNERKIQLGHAELLAGTVKELQDKALEQIVAKALPVAAVKDMLLKISKSMAAAIFDKSDCAACSHNSDLQSTLFSESVGTGSCTNGTCYDTKTEAELTTRRDALKDDFPRVEIVRPGDQFKIIKLVADGLSGVGEVQATACRGCTNFGAVVSAVPDKLGITYKDQCFDTACNMVMIAKRLKAEEESTAPASEKKTSQGKPANSSTKSISEKKEASEVTVQDSNRLKEYRVTAWRTITKKVLMSNKDNNLTVLIGLSLASEIRNVNSTRLTDGFAKLTKQSGVSFVADLEKALAASAVLPVEHREMVLMGISSSAMDTIEENRLIDIMKFLKVDLKSHWKLNKEFLKLLTKSELEALAVEVGLKAVLGDKFSKTMKQKNDEIIEAFLAIEGFEYAGVVPRSMHFLKT